MPGIFKKSKVGGLTDDTLTKDTYATIQMVAKDVVAGVENARDENGESYVGTVKKQMAMSLLRGVLDQTGIKAPELVKSVAVEAAVSLLFGKKDKK